MRKLFIAVCADVYLTILISVIVIAVKTSQNDLFFTYDFIMYGVMMFPIICSILLFKEKIINFFREVIH